MAGLGWTLRRLGAMSGGEIVHRLAERWRRESGRFASRGLDAFACGDGPLPQLPLSLDDVALSAAARSALIDLMNAGRSRRFRQLGVTWPETTPASPWSFDPVSEQSWPATVYCFDIPYRGRGGIGDIKYVWEVNRLQHLQAAALVAGEDESARRFILAEWLDWTRSNPPFRGVNWCSGIELSLRVVSALISFPAIGASASADERHDLRAMLGAHGAWLARFPSLFSSANNHRVAEGAGLFLLGLAFQDHPDQEQWENEGRAILETEIDRQFHADGVGAEQSPTYAAFSLEFFVLCAAMARRAGRPLSEKMDARIEHASAHLRAILDEGGAAPAIGDDDEGCVVAQGSGREAHYPATVAAMAGAYLGRSQLVHDAGAGSARVALVGPVAPGEPPRDGLAVYAEGGLSVVRFRRNADPWLLVFDHGPLGMGSIAAHGHADSLSIWLHCGPRALFRDAGTWRYHAGGARRDALRGTGAHNTVQVASADQSVIGGAFLWTHKAETRLLEAAARGQEVRLCAEHSGYVRRFDVVHRRMIELDPRALVIEDRLMGPTVEARAGWTLGEGVLASPDGDSLVITCDGKPVLRATASSPLEIAAVEVSPAFGELAPAQRIEAALDAKGRLTTRFEFL
jgi:hypothetical protein